MKDIGPLLESERAAERQLVAEAAGEGAAARGWTAALMMFHLARWRGRLLHAMSEHAEGRPFDPPTGSIDELNDAELSGGAHISLADASADSDAKFGALIDLWTKFGERPLKWYMASTTAEALTRNSYSHPRIHMAQYYFDRDDKRRAHDIIEKTVANLRMVDATSHILGAALCNLAGVRASQDRPDEAMELLEEGLPMRTDLIGPVATDPDLASLRDLPRFRELVARYSR